MSKYMDDLEQKRISAMNTYKQIKQGENMDILDLICERAGLDKAVVAQRLIDKIPEGMTAFNYAAPGLTVTFFRQILMDDFKVSEDIISDVFEAMAGGAFDNIVRGVFNDDNFTNSGG